MNTSFHEDEAIRARANSVERAILHLAQTLDFADPEFSDAVLREMDRRNVARGAGAYQHRNAVSRVMATLNRYSDGWWDR